MTDTENRGGCFHRFNHRDGEAEVEVVSQTTETIIPIEYTMKKWVDNFESYLKSAMSYCGKRTLEEFVGNVRTEVMSENSVNSINK